MAGGEPKGAVYQRFPSGPAVKPCGPTAAVRGWVPKPRTEGVTLVLSRVMAPDGVAQPTVGADEVSVNHRLASGPTIRYRGTTPLRPAPYSEHVPPGVIMPMDGLVT